MPRYLFSTSRDGLIHPVWMGLDGLSAGALAAAGQTVPPSIVVAALIDTAADMTCVAPSLVTRLGLPYVTARRSTGLGSQLAVQTYRAAIGVPPHGTEPIAEVWNPFLEVMLWPNPLAIADVLIGLDLILGSRLLIDGPNGIFTLDF